MADGTITVEVSTQAAQAELERLRADNTTEAEQSGPPGMVRLTAGLGINWGAEQAAFEQWYLTTQCGKNYRRVMKNGSGYYVDMLVRIAWRAWRHGVERAAAGKVAVDA